MQRPEKGAHSGGAHQESQGARSAMQNIMSINRHENRVLQSKKAETAQQQQRRPHRHIAHHKSKALQKSLQWRFVALGDFRALQAHEKQRYDYRDKTHAVQKKAPALSHPRNRESRQG